MANNKNFKVKNSLQTTKLPDFAGTATSGFESPGGLFSTTLYTGNASTQSVATNVDLSAGNEGLVWIKGRDAGGFSHHLFDTVRGATKYIKSDATNAEQTDSNMLTGFTSTGFNLGSTNATNNNSSRFVAWTWKSAANFFDVVTYTGNSTARTISHNLGSVPGMIIIKETTGSGDWIVYHRGNTGAPQTDALKLHSTVATTDNAGYFNDTAPTSTEFSLGNHTDANGNGKTFIAYLFAHNDSTISCGSYTGNGSNTGPSVNVGFEPEFVMIKSSTGSESWYVYDTARGMVVGGDDAELAWNLNNEEDSILGTNKAILDPTATGFNITNTSSTANTNSHTYVYMAIKKINPKQTIDLSTGNRFSFTPTAAVTIELTNPPATGTPTGFSIEVVNSGAYALTWPSSIKWHGGSAPTVNAGKAVYVFITTDGGTTYFGKLAGEGIA